MLSLHKLHLTTCQASDVINIFASVKIWLWLWPCFELLAFLCTKQTIQLTSCKRFDNNCYHLLCIAIEICTKLLNNFLCLCWCIVVFNLLACGKLWRCQLKLDCLTHFRGLSKLPNVAYNAFFWLILKWLFSKCLYSTFLCVFTMYNTGWAKTRRALNCVFTIMVEISGRYWQILDRSGKKIILLSPLLTLRMPHALDARVRRYVCPTRCMPLTNGIYIVQLKPTEVDVI